MLMEQPLGDQTFTLSIGRELQRIAQQLGAPVPLDVYQGGEHDFLGSEQDQCEIVR